MSQTGRFSSPFHMPNFYRPTPAGPGPLFWMDEYSGVLKAAVTAFLEPDPAPFSADQLRLIKEYIAHWINAPCWKGLEARQELTARVNAATDRRQVWAVLHELLDLGIDPL